MLPDRPGPTVVEPGAQLRGHDPPKAGRHRDLTGTHREEAAAKVENHERRRGWHPQPPGREPEADQTCEPVGKPPPLLGDRRAPEARDQEAGQHDRSRDLDRLGHEPAGLAEGGRRVHFPPRVDPVEGVAGEQAHDGDGGEVDGDHAAAEKLEEHDDGADVGGGAREEEHERRPRVQPLENQRGRDRCGGGGAGVDRDADQEHREHRREPAAQIALDERSG